MGGRRSAVWIVDDDATVGTMLVRFLSVHGYEVRAFTDPFELLTACDRHLPDAILADRNMRRLDGVALARRLLERFGAETPPIMCISGSVVSLHPTDRDLFAAHMTKPFRISEVEATLRRLTKSRR